MIAFPFFQLFSSYCTAFFPVFNICRFFSHWLICIYKYISHKFTPRLSPSKCGYSFQVIYQFYFSFSWRYLSCSPPSPTLVWIDCKAHCSVVILGLHCPNIMESISYTGSFVLFFSFFFSPVAYGGSQARGLIGAVAVGLYHSHSNVGSKPHL